MAVLKNRKIAVLIAVVVAVLATLFGVYRTSARYTRNIEVMFYDGVYLKDEGYTQPGIGSHLNNAANAALGLATVMADGDSGMAHTAGEVLSARRDLIAASSISDKSAANLRMWHGFLSLVSMMESEWPKAVVSGRERDAEMQFFEPFRVASNAMSSSKYNDKVTEYLDGRSVLMRTICILVPERKPEYFEPPDVLPPDALSKILQSGQPPLFGD